MFDVSNERNNTGTDLYLHIKHLVLVRHTTVLKKISQGKKNLIERPRRPRRARPSGLCPREGMFCAEVT